MAKKRDPNGCVVAVGGREDKSGDRRILRAIVDRLGRRPLVVSTVASTVPDELWSDYREVFSALGVADVTHLSLTDRSEADHPDRIAAVERAGGVFFTGGDQLRIASKLGGTELAAAVAGVLERGGIVAGTSAGASVMSETMLVSGPSDGSLKVRDSLRMAPGLGFVRDMVIDQHFAERGRIARLLAAVAQNPRILGVGIDEDTALFVEDGTCRVVGSGAVYVVDGHELTHTNVTEGDSDETLTLWDVRLHVLAHGCGFDPTKRRPLPCVSEE